MWTCGKLWEGVPLETAETLFVSEKGASVVSAHDRRKQMASAFSTTERPSPWNRMRKRCVSCVPSSVVALSKPELSTPVLRTRVLRTEIPRSVALAYPQKSPKDTLKRVFERMKRTARTQKSMRLAERFAPRNSVQRLRQKGSSVSLN